LERSAAFGACSLKPRSASYGRFSLGAFVPVAEPDLGCGDGMLGGELAEKAKLDPAGEIVK
ncbi:MAG TPA: hypothetical protein VMT56_03595, partial [Candidatus Bathyarchaeia archaeon]|nr:hypothetical protein [Candidatus Bathyarchaeia archaeon]